MRPIDILIAHTAVTWALVGLIWTVQVVLYPGFPKVGPREIPAYHAQHCRRITLVVAPLMLAELSTGIWLWLEPPASLSSASVALGLAPVLVNWLVTLLLFVPLHAQGRVGQGLQNRRLVGANWIRTSAWTLRGIWTVTALQGIQV